MCSLSQLELELLLVLDWVLYITRKCSLNDSRYNRYIKKYKKVHTFLLKRAISRRFNTKPANEGILVYMWPIVAIFQTIFLG